MITVSVFIDLLRETGAKTVVWTALYEPWIADRDSNLKSKLESRGIKVRLLNSSLILKKVFEKPQIFVFPFSRFMLNTAIYSIYQMRLLLVTPNKVLDLLPILWNVARTAQVPDPQ